MNADEEAEWRCVHPEVPPRVNDSHQHAYAPQAKQVLSTSRVDLVDSVSGVSNDRPVGNRLHVVKNDDTNLQVVGAKMSVSDTRHCGLDLDTFKHA